MELADDLFEHTVYEDKFIIISSNAIAPKINPTVVSAINDVLAVYESTQRVNGITTMHNITIALRNGKTMAINVYARKQETTDNLLLTIGHYCPNAMIGYNSEMLAYVREQRQEYKNRMKNI